MGMRSSWVAWAKPTLEVALEALGLEEAEQVALMEPGLYAFPRGEHQILVGSGSNFMAEISEVLARDISEACRTYFWTANDTSMTGRMSCWEDGALVWSVDYPSGGVDPVLEGDPPEVYASLLAEQRTLQDAEDASGDEIHADHVYEVLHRLGQALLGFRHDEFEPPEGCAPYALLKESSSPLPIGHMNEDAYIEVSATGHWEGFVVEVRAHQEVAVTIRRLDLDADNEILNLVEYESGPVRLAAGEVWSKDDASDAAAFALALEYTVAGTDHQLVLYIGPR